VFGIAYYRRSDNSSITGDLINPTNTRQDKLENDSYIILRMNFKPNLSHKIDL